LKEIQGGLQILENVWTITDSWRQVSDTWKHTQFNKLPLEEVKEANEVFRKDMMKLRKDMERKDVWIKLKEELDHFKRLLPVAEDLLSPAMRGRHWEQLMNQLDERFDYQSPEFCLFTLQNMK